MLDLLQQEFPLPDGWSKPEFFTEDFQLGSLRLQLVGFASTRIATGEEVTGSSAALHKETERAYYELLERCLIVDCAYNSQLSFPILNTEGQPTGKMLSHSEIFLPDTNLNLWKHSKSNGIAVHKNFQEASIRAYFEMAERDQVLRSWFGEVLPQALDTKYFSLPGLKELEENYQVTSYSFQDPNRPEPAKVVGTFGFPKQGNLPLIFGFGASFDFATATAHALGECFQRLGFIFDEEFAPTPEHISLDPSADFHLNWFLRSSSHSLIRQWLAGKNKKSPRAATKLGLVQYVELTKTPGKISLVKALQPGRLPLRFGRGYEEFYPHLSELEQAIHPIS